jgi:hypothetical protein
MDAAALNESKSEAGTNRCQDEKLFETSHDRDFFAVFLRNRLDSPARTSKFLNKKL